MCKIGGVPLCKYSSGKDAIKVGVLQVAPYIYRPSKKAERNSDDHTSAAELHFIFRAVPTSSLKMLQSKSSKFHEINKCGILIC